MTARTLSSLRRRSRLPEPVASLTRPGFSGKVASASNRIEGTGDDSEGGLVVLLVSKKLAFLQGSHTRICHDERFEIQYSFDIAQGHVQ